MKFIVYTQLTSDDNTVNHPHACVMGPSILFTGFTLFSFIYSWIFIPILDATKHEADNICIPCINGMANKINFNY